jgi:hypothetical protein
MAFGFISIYMSLTRPRRLIRNLRNLPRTALEENESPFSCLRPIDNAGRGSHLEDINAQWRGALPNARAVKFRTSTSVCLHSAYFEPAFT